ncbi:hypothetical protein D3C78_1963950 [compost metagenome]
MRMVSRNVMRSFAVPAMPAPPEGKAVASRIRFGEKITVPSPAGTTALFSSMRKGAGEPSE